MVEYHYGNKEAECSKVGYNKDRLDKLSEFYKTLVDTGRVQAAGFLMARKGKVFAHQTLGKLTYKEDSKDYEPQHIKGIASITKVITATAVMKLVEDGLLWIDQPVADVIKEFKKPILEKITLRHLMTHTSGLKADPGYFSEAYSFDHFRVLDQKNWIKKVLEGPIQSQPGEHWSYSSLGFCFLAEVVSRVSGQHFYNYVQDNIFKPLGMSDSYFRIPGDRMEDLCFLDKDDEKWTRKEHAETTLKGAPDGGGGVYSTLYDMYRFAQCILNGGTLDGKRIIGRTTVELMTRNQLKGVPAFHWGAECKDFPHGLGWGLWCDGNNAGLRTFSHEGWGWCSLYIDPDEEFIYTSFVADNKDFDPHVIVKPRTIAWSGIE